MATLLFTAALFALALARADATVPQCQLFFSSQSCFAGNTAKDLSFFPKIMMAHEYMPVAYGKIPTIPCFDLRSSAAPIPEIGQNGDALSMPAVHFDNNGCGLDDKTGRAQTSCPIKPMGQFWMVDGECGMNAIEVFTEPGCDVNKGDSYYWNLGWMGKASETEVVKKDGMWCAGPGTTLGLPVNIRSFRLLEGPPLPEPSGKCHGGSCKGGWWMGA